MICFFCYQMDVKVNFYMHFRFLLLLSSFISHAVHAETLNSTRILKDGEVIFSEDGSFKLSFFSPGNSTYRYVGVLFGGVVEQTVVWVANREDPVKDYTGVFKIRQDGNLVLLDGNGKLYWSSNATLSTNYLVCELLNNGNLILRNYGNAGEGGDTLWQSFDHPSDTFLADMKFGLNLVTGENDLLKNWRSDKDPAPGRFSLGFDPTGTQQIMIWDGSKKYWRSGVWNGQTFSGVPEMTSFHQYGFNIVKDNDADKVYCVYSKINKSDISRFVLSSAGKLERSYWYDGRWEVVWSQPSAECQFYRKCGPNGSCNSNNKGSSICNCLKGFKPKSAEEWKQGNWSGGCVRKLALECKEGSTADRFLKLSNVKLPDNSATVAAEGTDQCEKMCKENCSCMAFAYERAGLGCLTWQGDLDDIQLFEDGGQDLYLRLSKSYSEGINKKKWIFIFAAIGVGVILLLLFVFFAWKRIKRRKEGTNYKEDAREELQSWDWKTPTNSNRNYLDKFVGNFVDNLVSPRTPRKGPDLPIFVLDVVRTATDDFSLANKLGEGGFGPVYKGKLPSGQEIAVKRLSKGSIQGLQEFENEVILIAKLQHRNLVRLLGCCIQGDEKMLLYEYMPNKSLDAFLFDPVKRTLLDWRKRFEIIEGIARGLLYLHRDSRLRIIHRDLKASNILLGEDMNPKISDFGMARIFGGQQNEENTRRVVGTYGYMSPEYAMEGFFSVKSDVFSFGVLLLEIVSGKKNASFCLPDKHMNLLGYAWELWKNDKMLELLDTPLQNSYEEAEVHRCVQLGLLCVQDNAADRPTMDSVVFILGCETAVLPEPQTPTLSLGKTPRESYAYAISSGNCSTNGVTISVVMGR